MKKIFKITLNSRNAFDETILEHFGDQVVSGSHLKKLLYNLLVTGQSTTGPQRNITGKKASHENRHNEKEPEPIGKKACVDDIRGDF